MIKMTKNETKTCRIVPKKYRTIPDILPENGRIEEETTMDLNYREIIRAMTDADVYTTVDGEEVLLDPTNFDDLIANAETDEEDNSETEEEPSTETEDAGDAETVSTAKAVDDEEDKDFPF